MDDTNWKNRKERAKALIAAGWTDFDSYIHKREEAAGNPNCGGKMDISILQKNRKIASMCEHLRGFSSVLERCDLTNPAPSNPEDPTGGGLSTRWGRGSLS